MNEPIDDTATPEKMDADSRRKLLLEKIETSLSRTRKGKLRNKKWASIFRISTIVMACTATITLGLDFLGMNFQFKIIAFVSICLATLLNSIEVYFDFRSLWVEFESAQAKFYQLKDKVEFYSMGASGNILDMEQLNRFFEEYNEIWRMLSDNWISFRRKTGSS